jgi:hypothetical protein
MLFSDPVDNIRDDPEIEDLVSRLDKILDTPIEDDLDYGEMERDLQLLSEYLSIDTEQIPEHVESDIQYTLGGMSDGFIKGVILTITKLIKGLPKGKVRVVKKKGKGRLETVINAGKSLIGGKYGLLIKLAGAALVEKGIMYVIDKSAPAVIMQWDLLQGLSTNITKLRAKLARVNTDKKVPGNVVIFKKASNYFNDGETASKILKYYASVGTQLAKCYEIIMRESGAFLAANDKEELLKQGHLVFQKGFAPLLSVDEIKQASADPSSIVVPIHKKLTIRIGQAHTQEDVGLFSLTDKGWIGLLLQVDSFPILTIEEMDTLLKDMESVVRTPNPNKLLNKFVKSMLSRGKSITTDTPLDKERAALLVERMKEALYLNRELARHTYRAVKFSGKYVSRSLKKHQIL